MNETNMNNANQLTMNRTLEGLLNKCILFELKYVQKFCPLGIYILPQNKNLKTWNGVIYLKDGLFQKGAFKFIVNIPDIYPSVPPQVFFQDKILHPLVEYESGKLDLGKKFENWQPGKNLILHVLLYLKNIFYNPIYLQDKDSLNSEYGKLFTEDYNKFKQDINQICEQTYQERNKQLGSEVNSSNIQTILDKLSSQNKNTNLSSTEKIKELKKWFLTSYVQKLRVNQENK